MQEGMLISVRQDAGGLFYTDLSYCGIPIATHRNGEFDLILENEDRSIHVAVPGWKAEVVRQDGNKTLLSGSIYCGRLSTYVFVEVVYCQVNAQVVKRIVRLSQFNIPLLFYQISETLDPVCRPERFWSFDNPDYKGGLVYGTYPAAGFLTDNGIAAGLLTDAGHRNLWTRNIRRRPDPGKSGFTAIRQICDARLLAIEAGQVRLTFGCLSDFSAGERCVVPVSDPSQWVMLQGSILAAGDEKEFTVSGTADCGLFLPFLLADGFYTLSFSYQARGPVNLRVHKEHPEREVCAFHYQDDLPGNSSSWTDFQDSFFISDTESLPTWIKIWQQVQDRSGELSIRHLKLIRHLGQDHPYHHLVIGHAETKTTFTFAQPAASIRDLRLASQLHLAEGLDFTGSDPEKVLFADMQMLTWITSQHDFTPLVVPSINYAPDMYNRDAFWSICGLDDKALSQSVFMRWGATQTASGAIGTIVTPCMGSVEVKGNEATCEWLWWALINQHKYGLAPPPDKVGRAFEFCAQEFDREKSGVCKAHFVLGQNDVTTFPGDSKTSDLSLNQGVWAVTLRVAKDLGLPVDQDWIDRAISAYQEFYSESSGYLINDRLHPYAISLGDLMPEFVSFWLWGEPMLSDAAVINTLEHVHTSGDCALFMGHAKNKYFSLQDIPCDPKYFWPGGIYYNGGSWLREEIMAYVCGLRHGWEAAAGRIRRRLDAEINLNVDEPFSHEFIPTDQTVPGCWWPSARVFGWNVFALTALEVGGMRHGS